jgi:hypothetical protein
MLHLEPTARAKRLLKELPAFLAELEGNGSSEIPSQRRRHVALESIEGRARVLGIVSGNQSGTDFPGSIYLTTERSPERTGGMVDGTGSAVPGWVRDFLFGPTPERRPGQAGTLRDERATRVHSGSRLLDCALWRRRHALERPARGSTENVTTAA